MVARLFAPQFVILYLFAASATYVHFRGKMKLRLGRQLADHSTWLAPYNVLMYMFQAVPNKPVHAVSSFPELAPLRDNWQTIREEALNLFDEGRIRAAANNTDWGFHSFFKSGWKRFYLKWYEDALPSAVVLCPKTVELVNAIPNVHGAMFAMLPPGAKLGAHRDPFAGSLRYHLGLKTPNSDDCFIIVDGEKCVWRDGEAIMFDETFIHTAENRTDQNRIILFCDVERPMTFGFMRSMNRWVSKHIVKASSTQNEEGEKVGVINKLFSQIYSVHSLSRRMKAWNYHAYYAVKFTLVALVVEYAHLDQFVREQREIDLVQHGGRQPVLADEHDRVQVMRFCPQCAALRRVEGIHRRQFSRFHRNGRRSGAPRWRIIAR